MKHLLRLLLGTAVAFLVLCGIVGSSFDIFTHYLSLNALTGRPALEAATFLDSASPLKRAVEGWPESPIQWAAAIASLVAILIALWIIWKVLLTHFWNARKKNYRPSGSW
ncbi:hypothetical protein C4587_03055 [Candidatus Parcubacteria bacterium]|nr:MAG: hypothetical protein C4587_03055 [Candidatus Parcubacteria bacterium]